MNNDGSIEVGSEVDIELHSTVLDCTLILTELGWGVLRFQFSKFGFRNSCWPLMWFYFLGEFLTFVTRVTRQACVKRHIQQT